MIMSSLRVTLVRSQIGIKPKQRGTFRALGLRKIGSHEHVARPARGPRDDRPGAAPDHGGGAPVKIHDLKPAPGLASREAPRRRVASAARAARPRAAAARARARVARCRPGFEGGQTPLHRRTPKAKGFNNPFRVEYHVVNLSTLDGFDAGAEVTPDTLRAHGLVAKRGLVKMLARGELTKSLTVRAHGFSAAAVRAIEAAGGSAEVLPLPWPTGVRRLAGTQLTNR